MKIPNTNEKEAEESPFNFFTIQSVLFQHSVICLNEWGRLPHELMVTKILLKLYKKKRKNIIWLNCKAVKDD